MKTRFATLALVIAGAFATGALANGNPDASGDPLQKIASEQAALKADMQGEGRKGYSARQVKAIGRAQDEVFQLIEGKASLDDLTIAEKVRLENALERINAEVKNTRSARDGREVCKRERATGSGIVTTRCASQQERDELREGARSHLERPRVCDPSGCGGG